MKKKVKPSIIIITGPTGIGKTSTSIELVENFGGEIISADAMQVYKYMDIGTAKPCQEEQARAKHHLINVVAPDENFNASTYSELASKIIENHNNKGIISYVTGGTGLYIKALTNGLFNDEGRNPEIRNNLKKQAKDLGNIELYNKLKDVDPEASKKINPNDIFRIIRALEVFLVTGKKISELHKNHNFQSNQYYTMKIALTTDRKLLYDRINKRVDIMLKQGFIQEVSDLLKKGYSMDLKSMNSIGYRHICKYLSNELSLDKAIDLLKRDTRRYAKRQLTWFKKDPEIIWIEPNNIKKKYSKIEAFIS